MINSIAVVGGAAILNRAAGSDLYGLPLPGKPAMWVAVLIGFLAAWMAPLSPELPVWSFWPVSAIPWLNRSPQPAPSPAIITGVTWALSYWFWRLWEHGRWIDLENDPTDPNRLGIAMTLFEQAITAVSFGNDYLALFWRHLPIWPGLVLVWYLGGPQWLAWSGPGVAVVLALCHWFAKRVRPADFHPLAERLHGAVIGALIVGAAS